MNAPIHWKPPTPTPARFEALGVVLRAYEASDAGELHAAIDESRASMLPWLPWAATQHLSVEASRESIALMRRARADLLHHELGSMLGAANGIFCPDSGALLGGIGLVRINAGRHAGELGCWVRASRRREGVCERATAAMLSWSFLAQDQGGFGLRRVMIFAAAANRASCGVLRKMGLHQFGTPREEIYLDGMGWVDGCGFDVLAREWDVGSHAFKRG